jgi:hypothetical protein
MKQWQMKAADKARCERVIGMLTPPPGFTQSAPRIEGENMFVAWEAEDMRINFYLGGVDDYDAFRAKYRSHRAYQKAWRAGKRPPRTISASGDVSFDTVHGRLTFSRHGIEDSFYWTKRSGVWCDAEGKSLQDVLLAQIQRAREAQTRHAGISYQVCPRVGTLLTPDQIEKMKQTLLSGKNVLLTPSGMGIGWQVQRGFRRGRQPCLDLEKFFGVTNLYCESFDYD